LNDFEEEHIAYFVVSRHRQKWRMAVRKFAGHVEYRVIG
jgi:hypothetical protein